MPIQELGLAASLLAGVLFLLAALRRRPPAPEAAEAGPGDPEADIYWPALLGTGERSFDKAMRLAIVRQLAHADEAWRYPILLCAREQERDPEILAAVGAALGDAIRPVIGAPGG